jgi:hypothetical protein
MMPGARCLHAYYTYAGRSSSIRAEGAAAMAKCKLDCTETRDIVALNVPLWRGGRQTTPHPTPHATCTPAVRCAARCVRR